MALSRVITNLPIFFTNNNMINYEELGNHINTVINSGITHLVILDTPEAATLSEAERLQFAQYVYNNFHNYVQIIVGHSELALYANYIMLTTPTEANYTQEGLYQHFMTLFNNINRPIILSCGENLSPATLQRLSLNNNLVAIKDTSDNIPHLMHVIDVCPNLQVFTSNDKINTILNYPEPSNLSVVEILYNQEIIEILSSLDFTAPNYNKIHDALYPDNINSLKTIKNILAEDPIISTIVKANQGRGFFAVRDALLRDFTPVNVKETAENLPARTISKVDPVVFGEVINSVFQRVAMKKGTPEQVNALVQEFLPKLETGTLTETKKVKNPKTGKLESVTTVTPGMSQDKAEISIEQRIKELYPDEVDRAARINWNSWLTKNTAGA